MITTGGHAGPAFTRRVAPSPHVRAARSRLCRGRVAAPYLDCLFGRLHGEPMLPFRPNIGFR